MKIITTVPKLISFKTTYLYAAYLLSAKQLICRQLKHHPLKIRSEILISLEIILNACKPWRYHFPLKFLFWL